jgi:hypothetical protein
MEHVVFHSGPDGAPEFRRFASLDEAVPYVEHLRNVEGVVDVSVHQLTPVPLAFRAYYKVEVPAGEAVGLPVVPDQPLAFAPVEPVASALPVDGPVDVPVAIEPVEVVADGAAFADTEVAAPTGKRTLGFFAH